MQPWWADVEKDIRTEEDAELDSRLSKIIDRSLDAVADRIDNGDFLLDSRTGSIRRVPVKMRDVQRTATDLIDKRNLIRGKPTSITERVTVDDVMRKLADEFSRWSKGQQREEKILDINSSTEITNEEVSSLSVIVPTEVGN